LFGSYNLFPATAFPGLPGIQQGEKRVLVRPENIRIVAAGAGSLTASVNKVTFYGSFYKVEALLAGNALTIKTAKHPVVEGDTIHISVVPEDVWYL
jgi:iron(III) transport system ATP-binding protein